MALEDAADGVEFAAAVAGGTVDAAAHGIAQLTEYGIVYVNTATAGLSSKRKLDGTEFVVGVVSPGSGGTGGSL